MSDESKIHCMAEPLAEEEDSVIEVNVWIWTDDLRVKFFCEKLEEAEA